MSSARPIWLGDDRRPSFAWWHGPDDGRLRAGVVLCPPLGFDYLQSHYALRLLAEQLADTGFDVVRLDYDGTGDSAGDDRDPDRVPAWLDTIASATAFLRQRGAPAICLVGMRAGATLAAQAAATDGDMDQVVLWDPCASGKAFLTEQRGVSALVLRVGARGKDGSLEIPGHVYGTNTVRDLERLSIGTAPRPLGRRVLLLARPDRPFPPGLADASLASKELCVDEATGQHELMDLHTPNQRLPHAAIRRVVDWLSAGARAPGVAVAPPPATSSRVVAWDARQRPVYETPITVPPIGLFGIETRVEDAGSTSDAPTVLLLNNGTHHHVGPSRAWVELARRWAAAGIRSIRLDLSGMGDSPKRDAADALWACNKPDAFDDVADAVRWACPEPANAVLVGLCSSGYQALESALDLGAGGVVAINPSIAFVPAERRAGRPLYRGRRIVLPKDDIAGTFREGGRLGWLRDATPGLAWRVRTTLSPGHRSGRWLTDLSKQGTNTLLVCGDSELRPVRNGITGLQLRRLTTAGLVRLVHVPGLQHALLAASGRERVVDLVADHVLARFGSAGDSAAPYASPVAATS